MSNWPSCSAVLDAQIKPCHPRCVPGKFKYRSLSCACFGSSGPSPCDSTRVNAAGAAAFAGGSEDERLEAACEMSLGNCTEWG